MTESSAKTQKAFVISNFSDAGTGERFEAGATPSIEAGVFANYKAAGLVRKARANDGRAKPAA